MGVADIVQGFVASNDRLIDPCLRALRPTFSAGLHDLTKAAVDPHLKTILPHDFGERARNMKFMQRNNAPAFWLNPEDIGITGIFCHWKHPARVGAKQQVGRQQCHAA